MTRARNPSTIKVLYITNEGGGYSDEIELPSGSSVDAFFRSKMPGGDPADFTIRVNREGCSSDQILQDGDRVSVTPNKIQGA